MMARTLISILCLTLSALLTFAQTPAENAVARSITVVPDSLLPQVHMLLSGRYKLVPSDEDLSEKVTFRGDTIPMVIRDRNIGRFHRGLSNWLFIPANTWQFGLTASYAEFSSSDLQVLDLLTEFDFSGHTLSIKPYLSFFIRNNLALGMRLGYSSSKGNLDALGIDFDEDLNFNISDAMYRSEALSAAIFARQYIGLAKKSRFGVFNELELSFSSGNSDFKRLFDDKPKTTTTTYSDLRLNFSPGLTVFINPYVSFNVAFAVVGLYLRNEKQSVNGEYSGNRFTSGANFKFNLFNINFGLGIHL